MSTATSGSAPDGLAKATTAYTSLLLMDNASGRYFCPRFAPTSALAVQSAIAFSWPQANRCTRCTSRLKARTFVERTLAESTFARTLERGCRASDDMTTANTYGYLSVSDRARRRIMRRIMPYLILLFIVAFLDRVNVTYAALRMREDLSFTDEVLGFGAGIFFVGYFLLEIPGTILVERWSARGWIARIMISWGILAILTGFVHSKSQFYWIRFF